MPVISTDVLELLKSLGLDDEKALRAASAVGVASDQTNRNALAEIAALRHAVANLTDRLASDAAAQRVAIEGALTSAAATQARAMDAGLAALRAETEAMRRALAAAEVALHKAGEDAAAGRRIQAQLSIAIIILILLGTIVSILA